MTTPPASTPPVTTPPATTPPKPPELAESGRDKGLFVLGGIAAACVAAGAVCLRFGRPSKRRTH
ncbi:hypothetical protein [Streptomyces sp. SID5785]|uniref:hypothetical protein n=1 Tax=Streptomyces sp. SID5785 TaxID=2690309 RepID=UPI0019260752|nr:hypothetical protein [Streptomyces sp. SID5785]